MMFKKSYLKALALAFLTTTDAHVKIEEPVPYGAGNGAPALDTNPLLADGSDFPCKQRQDVYKLVHNNVMAVGQPQTLSFQGQATHGGGSCQISLSTDKNPTKDSVWKVILSIQGGCPSKNPGNVGEDPFGYGADKFQYTIPPQISPGEYTLAFTWFNKIGHREMYMNCAPITVTGSSKRSIDNSTISDLDNNTLEKRNDMSSLPNMFVANIGNGCSTAERSDLAFPAENLGKIVQRIDTGPLTPPIGNCGQKNSGAQSSPDTPNPAGAAQPIPSAPQPTTSIPAIQSSVPTTPLVQPSTSVVQPEPSTSVAEPEPSTNPAPAQPTTSLIPVSAGSPPLSQIPSLPGLTIGSCPTPGKSVCSDDGLGFGTCDEFHSVIFQPVPAGTRCDKGLGVEVLAKRRNRIR